MTTLSLAMIVKDAQPTLARLLECVTGLCDELVVVDTGSKDLSAEIALQMGAKVYQFEWIDDFAAARNYSFAQCSGDWILWLDADDVIQASSVQKLFQLKGALLDETIDAIYLPYQVAFNALDKCELSLYRERLLRRQAGLTWNYPVHECITVPADRATSIHDIFVEHRPTLDSRASKQPERNLRIIEKAFANGAKSDRMQFYYANELYDLCRYAEAISAYELVVQSQCRQFEVYWAMRHLSHCYSFLEQPDQALDWGLRAIATEPERAEAFNDVGLVYYKQERFSEAIRYFTSATSVRAPQTSFVEDCHYQWLPYDYLSSCYLATGDYKKALENGLKALPDHPDKDRLQENLKFLERVGR